MKVTQETIDKLEAFIATLPTEAKNKCSLCNQALVHLVGKTMAETGAPQSTVCRCLADSINETAAPLDKVNGKKLKDKVDYHTKGKKVKCGNSENKNQLKVITKKENQHGSYIVRHNPAIDCSLSNLFEPGEPATFEDKDGKTFHVLNTATLSKQYDKIKKLMNNATKAKTIKAKNNNLNKATKELAKLKEIIMFGSI
jgi:hypothetical protein